MTDGVWWREYFVASDDGSGAKKVLIKLEEVAAVEEVVGEMSRITLRSGAFWRVRAQYNVVKGDLRLGGWSVP